MATKSVAFKIHFNGQTDVEVGDPSFCVSDKQIRCSDLTDQHIRDAYVKCHGVPTCGVREEFEKWGLAKLTEENKLGGAGCWVAGTLEYECEATS